MNLSDQLSDRLTGLGAWTKMDQAPAVSSSWLETGGHRRLFLEPCFFAARGTFSEGRRIGGVEERT